MIQPDTKKALVAMGKKCYSTHVSPEGFAVQAATHATIESLDLTNVYGREACAFLASSEFVHLSQFSMQLAGLAMKEQAVISGKDSSDLEAFDALALRLNAQEVGQDVLKLVEQIFKDTSSDALRTQIQKAQKLYMHIYAASYCAYLRSVALASQYGDDQKEEVFVSNLSEALAQELFMESLSPSFLMQVFTSDAFKIAATVLLLGGLCMLAAISIPVISTAVTTFTGMSALAMTITGGGALMAGTVGQGLSFFMTRQNSKIHEAQLASIDGFKNHGADDKDEGVEPEPGEQVSGPVC